MFLDDSQFGRKKTDASVIAANQKFVIGINGFKQISLFKFNCKLFKNI